MSHAYNCPCARCADAEEAAVRDDAQIDALVAEYRKDPDKLREAESWVAGTFDEGHYTDVTLALWKLARTEPSDLLGSDVLATLYRLAQVDHDAIETKLREMAEQ